MHTPAVKDEWLVDYCLFISFSTFIMSAYTKSTDSRESDQFSLVRTQSNPTQAEIKTIYSDKPLSAQQPLESVSSAGLLFSALPEDPPNSRESICNSFETEGKEIGFTWIHAKNDLTLFIAKLAFPNLSVLYSHFKIFSSRPIDVTRCLSFASTATISYFNIFRKQLLSTHLSERLPCRPQSLPSK